MAASEYGKRTRGDQLAASGWHVPDPADPTTGSSTDDDGSSTSFAVFLESSRRNRTKELAERLDLQDIEASIVHRVLDGTDRVDVLVDDVDAAPSAVLDSLRSLQRLGYIFVDGEQVEPTTTLERLSAAST